jgi:uncharacterized protein YajQ (UPF0234 family)
MIIFWLVSLVLPSAGNWYGQAGSVRCPYPAAPLWGIGRGSGKPGPIPGGIVPSFDIVSEVDRHEVTNAVDQARRELGKRYDFKGVAADFKQEGEQVSLRAPSEFQVKQMFEILTLRLAARQVDLRCLKLEAPEVNVAETRQMVTIRSGIETELARKIVKLIKTRKMKVQAAIQGDKVRVTGKKRDDLQQVIAMLKEEELEMPLQFDNFRD